MWWQIGLVQKTWVQDRHPSTTLGQYEGGCASTAIGTMIDPCFVCCGRKWSELLHNETTTLRLKGRHARAPAGAAQEALPADAHCA